MSFIVTITSLFSKSFKASIKRFCEFLSIQQSNNIVSQHIILHGSQIYISNSISIFMCQLHMIREKAQVTKNLHDIFIILVY